MIKSKPGSKIILFDGVCNLCNGTVNFIIKQDAMGIFRFASMQSDSGQQLLEKYHLPESGMGSFVLIFENKCYIKSTGVLEVLKSLGGFWKLFYVFIFFPRPFRDWIYDLVARNRYRLFGKRESCMVPRPEVSDRFLV